MRFVHFMASPTGRVIRVIAGVFLMYLGLGWLGGPAGSVLAIVGLIPFFAGVFDVCLFAPLWHLPLSGHRIRSAH